MPASSCWAGGPSGWQPAQSACARRGPWWPGVWTPWAMATSWGAGVTPHHRQSPACAARRKPAIKSVSGYERDIYLEVLAIKNYSFIRKTLVWAVENLCFENSRDLLPSLNRNIKLTMLVLILTVVVCPLDLLTEVLPGPKQCQAHRKSPRQIGRFN